MDQNQPISPCNGDPISASVRIMARSLQHRRVAWMHDFRDSPTRRSSHSTNPEVERRRPRRDTAPGLTNDDEPISWYFGGFLTDLKVLSAALMKNGLKRRPGVASSSERENSRIHLVKLDRATAAWRRQCAQCAPSCSPQSPYAHAIGPSYQNFGGEKACNREKAQP